MGGNVTKQVDVVGANIDSDYKVLETVFNARNCLYAHSYNSITPGSPSAFRAGLNAKILFMSKALLTDKPVPLGRLTRVERLAVERVRACADGQRAATSSCAALIELIEQAKAAGFEIWQSAATFVAPSELRLLSLLAMSQRVTLDIERIEPTLNAALSRASLALRREGIKLGFGTITRVQPDAPSVANRIPAEGRDSLRMKALRHARERGTMSPGDFMEIGVTRQYLSQLCARGDFVRIRPALYRAR